MAAPLTPEEHESKKWDAYRRSLRGEHAPAIAQALDVNAQTVRALLKEARREVARDRKEKGHDDLGQFLGEQDAVIADAWARLAMFPADSPATNVVGLQSNAAASSVNKAKVLGLFTDKVEHSGSLDLLMQFLRKPVTIEIAQPGDTSEFE